jgi:hypothetical protein
MVPEVNNHRVFATGDGGIVIKVVDVVDAQTKPRA